MSLPQPGWALDIYNPGSGECELLKTNFTVDTSVEQVIILIIQAEKTGNTDDVVYIDSTLYVEGTWNSFDFYARQMIKELSL